MGCFNSHNKSKLDNIAKYASDDETVQMRKIGNNKVVRDTLRNFKHPRRKFKKKTFSQNNHINININVKYFSECNTSNILLDTSDAFANSYYTYDTAKKIKKNDVYDYFTFEGKFANIYNNNIEKRNETNIANYSTVDVYQRLNCGNAIYINIDVYSAVIWDNIAISQLISEDDVQANVIAIEIDDNANSRQYIYLNKKSDAHNTKGNDNKIFYPFAPEKNSNNIFRYSFAVEHFKNKYGIVKITMKLLKYMKDEHLLVSANESIYFSVKDNKENEKYPMYTNLYYEKTNAKIANVILDVSYKKENEDTDYDANYSNAFFAFPYIEYAYCDYCEDDNDNANIFANYASNCKFNSVSDIDAIDLSREQFEEVLEKNKTNANELINLLLHVSKRFYIFEIVKRIAKINFTLKKKQKNVIIANLIAKLSQIDQNDTKNDLLTEMILKCIYTLIECFPISTSNENLIANIIINKVIHSSNENILYFAIVILSKIIDTKNKKSLVMNTLCSNHNTIIKMLIYLLSSELCDKYTLMSISIMKILILYFQSNNNTQNISSIFNEDLFVKLIHKFKHFSLTVSLLLQLYSQFPQIVILNSISILKQIFFDFSKVKNATIIEPIIAILKNQIKFLTSKQCVNDTFTSQKFNEIIFIFTSSFTFLRLNFATIPLHSVLIITYTISNIINNVNANIYDGMYRVLYLNQINEKIIDLLLAMFASKDANYNDVIITDKVLLMRMMFYSMNIILNVYKTFKNSVSLITAKKIVLIVKKLQEMDKMFTLSNDNSIKGYCDYYLRYKNMMISLLNMAVRVIKENSK